MKILRLIRDLLGFATDHEKELGIHGKGKEILDGGRELGFWDQEGNWHPYHDSGKDNEELH